MNERQLRNAGAVVLVGIVSLFAGLALIWMPLALTVAGLLLVVLGVQIARTARPAE